MNIYKKNSSTIALYYNCICYIMLLMVYNHNLNMIIVNYWVKFISILLLMIHMLTSYSYVCIKQCSVTVKQYHLIFKNQTHLEI